MTALVTGGTGFVGSHLLAALLRRGTPVKALIRSPSRAEALGLAGVDWIPGDLSTPEALSRAVRGATTIYHLAGLVAARSEQEFQEVNVLGTERLLRAAESVGARFVYVSTLAAAGPSQPGEPLVHSGPGPVTAYGRSKADAEALVRRAAIPWVIVRPPAVYGPRDREMFRVFQASKLGLAAVFGTGRQELSLIYGPDLAEALVAAGDSESATGSTWYAAHQEILTSREVVTTIASAGGHRPLILRVPNPVARGALKVTGAIASLTGRATILTPDKGNELLQPAWTCSPDAFTRATGWTARHTLREGALATWQWYRQAGWI